MKSCSAAQGDFISEVRISEQLYERTTQNQILFDLSIVEPWCS